MALLILQTVHSGIVCVSFASVGILWWSVLTGRSGRWTVFAAAWLIAIALGLVLNGFVCPLQNVARWIEGTDRYVPDLLTPNWYNALIVPVLTPPAVLAMAWLLARALRRSYAAGRRRHGRVGDDGL